MLVNSNRKGPFSTSYVLFFTRTCQEIHCELSGTGGEVLHRVYPLCDRRLKCLGFASTVGIVETYTAFSARIIALAMLEK